MTLNEDVLARAAASGDDLTKPRDIEFEHLFPTKMGARRFVAWAEKLGYRCELEPHDYDWKVRCTIFMVPELEKVTDRESRLGELAQQMGGRADGWGMLQRG